MPEISSILEYRGGGLPQEEEHILTCISPYTHLLVTRQITENIGEICLKWPEISYIYKNVGVGLPREGVKYLIISSPTTHRPRQ